MSIAGGRHAMGGQQFGTDTVHVDMSGLNAIVEFDASRGHVEVGAGAQWPALVSALLERQGGQTRQWGIVQKQTGADRLSLGGALAANAHGRGLTYAPIAQDVEAFTLVDAGASSCVAAGARIRSCSAWSSVVTGCSASSPPCACGWRRGARSSAWSK